jgi:peroxiredoxin Q/BCP
MKLILNQSAPDFTLFDQDEISHTLSDYRGQWVLLYFYPKDDTPGCTKEACSFRDNFSEFSKLNIKVFGISADSLESHKKFVQKFNLPFSLLADTDKKVVEAYDVKKLVGIARTSFLINPEGKIARIYEGVKPAVHNQEVLKDLKELQKISL